MPLISGRAIKFDQRQFNFRMSREERLLVSPGTKTCKQVVIDKANSGIEQCAIARRPIIRNRALYHVADVVELVAPSLCFRRHALLCAIRNIVRIQISVGLLDCDNFPNNFFRERTQLWGIARLQLKTYGLRPFVNVGVRVHRTALLRIALSAQPQVIVHPAVGFEQFLHRRDALFKIRLASRSPKSLGNRHRMHRNVAQLGVRRPVDKKDSFVLPAGIRRTALYLGPQKWLDV